VTSGGRSRQLGQLGAGLGGLASGWRRRQPAGRPGVVATAGWGRPGLAEWAATADGCWPSATAGAGEGEAAAGKGEEWREKMRVKP
jgi:hypothetical protein